MELPEWIDSEVIGSPMYWVLTIGAEFALLLGFKGQELWGTDIGMPWYAKLITLLLVPVASYFITKKFSG